jgi:hypothetical protein
MTDLHSRLLAELMKPDRFVTSSILKVSEMAEKSASHRLASILRMIAEDEGALKAIAFAICRSGKFECGEGRCAVLCMDYLGDKPKECGHALRIHGKLASAALSSLLSILPEEK